MKTIEEALIKAINECIVVEPLVKADERLFKTGFGSGFMKGVKFAQQWISVEEELPKNGTEVVCKNTHGRCSISYYDSKDVGFVGSYLIGVITHWRPIEFE